MHLITTEDTDTVMELIRGAQTVFLWVKTEAKRWNAPPIAPSTQAELKDEFAPPPQKRKLKMMESQLKVKTCLELHSGTVLQRSP